MEKLQNLPAERAVLAGLFKFGSAAYVETSDILGSKGETSAFTLDSNQFIYKCLYSVLSKDDPPEAVDFATFISSASSLGLADFFTKKEEATHVRSVMNLPINLQNVRRQAAIIRKLEIARLLTNQLENAQADVENVTGEESLAEILARGENPIFDFTTLLSDGNEHSAAPIGNNVDEYVQYLIDNPCNIVGIDTGYKRYNTVIGGGPRRGTVNLIAARSKAGKSFLRNNISLYVSGHSKIPVLDIDSEMLKQENLSRILGILSGIPINEIETGKFSREPEKKAKVLAAAAKLKEMPYSFVNVSGKEFEEILPIIRRWIKNDVGVDENGRTKPCLLIYDYLKLMTGNQLSGHLQEYQALGFNISTLHNFCVKYDIPCIAFCQLNREGLKQEDITGLSGSDRQVWISSSLMYYKCKSEEDLSDGGGNMKMVYLLSRFGEGLPAGEYIHYNHEKKIGRITEGKYRSETDFKVND